jgi:hypothetical protein
MTKDVTTPPYQILESSERVLAEARSQVYSTRPGGQCTLGGRYMFIITRYLYHLSSPAIDDYTNVLPAETPPACAFQDLISYRPNSAPTRVYRRRATQLVVGIFKRTMLTCLNRPKCLQAKGRTNPSTALLYYPSIDTIVAVHS